MADDQGIMGAFKAPTMSSQMFKALADKTNMFTDPMGSETLGAVNRAIVGAPIDAIDLIGRVGDTALRGVASGAGKLAEGLGMGEGMADRLKRDVYGLGIAASTLAPTAAPRPRGKSNKALVIEAQKDKVKSPVAKQKLDEDLEMEAINDALKDAYLDLDDTLSFQSVDDIAITTEDFGDVLTNNFAGFRGEGKSRGEAMADAIKMTQDDFNVVIDRPIQDKIFARLDDDYDFGVKRALDRREKAAANKAALETELAKARNVNNPIRTVSIDEATRMQNEISGMGIPQPTPQKPALTVIEGGQPSKKKLTHDDLSTPELLTSYIISPTRNPENKLGVTRQELVERLSSDVNVQTKTQKSLDELGYGDTVPVFRTVILKDGKAMDPETVTSVSLSPRAFADTTDFLTQGKIGFGDTAIAVRYDVPRDKFVGYFPALADDIKLGVNKKIKEKGIGQSKIEGFETVTNPSAHAKELIQMQDEAIVDVSGIEAKPLKYFDRDETAVMLGLESSLARKIASQEVKSGPETRAALGENWSAVSPFNFKGTKEQFEQLNQETAQKMFDNYERFFRGNYKQGGMVYNPFKQGIGAI